MDRETIKQHLAQAEEHVRLGAEHVARQRALVAGLERDGHDTTLAKEMLRLFEETQQIHVTDRDRIAADLARTQS